MESWAVASHVHYDTMMILRNPTACPRSEKGHERRYPTRTRLGLQVARSRMPSLLQVCGFRDEEIRRFRKSTLYGLISLRIGVRAYAPAPC